MKKVREISIKDLEAAAKAQGQEQNFEDLVKCTFGTIRLTTGEVIISNSFQDREKSKES